jgi:hypothetical protein
MRYTKRIVIDVSFEHPDYIDEAALDDIFAAIEQDTHNEASNAVSYALSMDGLDGTKTTNINVHSFTKDLDDGD